MILLPSGGGTLGCNWQPVGSPFVLGLEGEGGYSELKGSGSSELNQQFISSSKIGDWSAAITGRLGYAFDRALFYVKGGAAFVPVELTVQQTRMNRIGSASDTVTTWTVGGGVEWALSPQWSIKAEYLYIGLDENLVAGWTLPSGDIRSFEGDVDGIHTVKVGLNYRFGGGAPAIFKN